MIEGLLEEKSLNLQVRYILDQQHSVAKKKRRGHLALACSLEISVYAHFELFRLARSGNLLS